MPKTDFKKLFLILSFFCINQIGFPQIDEKLIGKWTLVEIVDGLDTLICPDSINYYLIISQTSFNFSAGINTCDLYKVQTIGGRIISDRPSFCTEACCDERAWQYFDKINYQGEYWLQNDGKNLMIKNQGGILHLKIN